MIDCNCADFLLLLVRICMCVHACECVDIQLETAAAACSVYTCLKLCLCRDLAYSQVRGDTSKKDYLFAFQGVLVLFHAS